MPKKARLSVLAFEVQCPYCGQPVTEREYGSYRWEQGLKETAAGTEHQCDSCLKVFVLPKRVLENQV